MGNLSFLDYLGGSAFCALGALLTFFGIKFGLKPISKCQGEFDKKMRTAGWVMAPIGIGVIVLVLTELF